MTTDKKKGKAPAYTLGDFVPARSDAEDQADAIPGAGPVPVRGADGSVGTVERADLAQALDSGAQVVDEKALHAATMEAKYGGTGGTAAALGLGAVRGLTLGGSDALARKLGGHDVVSAMEGYKEANPTASTIGEVAGAAAPLIASDGLLGVAGVGVRATAETGELVGAGVRALVGEGGGLLARGARGVAEYGARGAAEGALYGAGEALSEASLGDRDLTSEELFATMGKGAIFGGALGAGQGALHGGAGWAGAKAGEGLAAAGRSLGEAADAVGKKVGEGATALGDAAGRVKTRVGEAATTAGRAVGEAADGVSARIDAGVTAAGDAVDRAGVKLGEGVEAAGQSLSDAHDFVRDTIGKGQRAAMEAIEDAKAHAQDLMLSAKEAAEAGRDEASAELERLAKEAERHADELYKRGGEVIQEGVFDAPVRGIDSGAVRVLSDKGAALADEAAFRALAPGKWNGIKGVREAERFGGIEGLGKTIREELPKLAGVKNFSEMDIEKAVDAAMAGKQREAARLNAVLDQAGKAAKEAGELPKAMDVVKKMNAFADELERGQLGASPAVNKFREIAHDTTKQLKLLNDKGVLKKNAEYITVELPKLRDLRSQIDDLTYKFGDGELKGYKAEFARLRSSIEKDIESAVDKYAGSESKAEYLNAKRKYGAFSTIEKMATEGKLSNSNNRFFSLGDRIAGSTGMLIGGAIGGVPGMIVGHSTGSLLGKYARERGGYMLGHYLTKEGQREAIMAGSHAAQQAAEMAREASAQMTDAARKASQMDEVIHAKAYVQREIVDAVKKAVHGSIDAAGNAVSSAKKTAMDAVDESKSKTRAATSRVVGAVDDARDAVKDARRAVRGAVEDVKGQTRAATSRVLELAGEARGAGARFGEDVAGRVSSARYEGRQFVKRTGERVDAAATASKRAAQESIDKVEQVERQIAAIQGAASSPDVLQAHVDRSMRGLDHLPETTAALAGRTSTAVQFLASKIPQRLPSTPLALGPRSAARSPYDPHEIRKFQAYVRAVEKPLSVIHDLGSGKATRQGVEALKVVYPQLYTKMTMEILHQLAGAKAKGKSPSYQKRLQLGIILGTATDWSMEPDAVKVLQQGASGAAEGDAPPPQAMAANGPARPLPTTASDDAMTTTGRIAT